MLDRPHHPTFVAIGASAGGLEQIGVILGSLPENLGAAVLIALHRPVDRVSHLREVLARRSRLPVVEAFAGERLLPGWCYLGLPAEHLGLDAEHRATLTDDPSGRLGRRTVDDLFLAVARHAGPRAIGVVLSGVLRDGAAGLAAIGGAGGVTMAQLPAEAAFPGMPQAAIDEGGALDLVASSVALAHGIARRVGGGGGRTRSG